MNGSTVMSRLAVLTTTAVIAVGTAACADTAEPTGGLAIVVGTHCNMPAPNLAEEGRASRERAIRDQSYLTIVVADGEPFQFAASTLPARNANSQIQKRDRDRNRRWIDEQLAKAAAKVSETDLLSALGIAARGVENAPGKHTLVVVDSGLSSAGPINFASQPELLEADAEALANSLADAGELPDLRGSSVIFQSLGETASPQKPLAEAQRASLIKIWTAVAVAAGAADVEIDNAPLSARPVCGSHRVTPVEVGPELECTVETLVLDEGAVGFEPDTDVFKDRAAVMAILKPIAERILAHDLSVTLTGTTADVGQGDGRKLSLERAQAVMALLEDLGVPSARMTAVGLGSHFPGYNADDLQANRKVTIKLTGTGGVNCS